MIPSEEDKKLLNFVEESEVGPEVLGSHCCDVCIGDNLLKATGICQCARCKNPFCIHFAAKADPLMYCVSCMSDLELIRTSVLKDYEHYNSETEVITRYRRKARKIEIQGESWLFAQRRFKSLTDAEADLVTEYHRECLNYLQGDAERRKAEKMHRNAAVKVILAPSTSTTTTTVTTTKQVSATKMNKNMEKAQALVAQFLQQQQLQKKPG